MEKLVTILAVIQDPDADAATLDKAAALARTFHARLHLLVRDPAEGVACAAHCAAAGHADVETFTIAAGELPEAVLRHLRSHAADLVIKRLATNGKRHSWLATVDQELAEHCPVPLLLARDRPWAKEPRFAATVDVADRDTESLARCILQSGGFLALGCEAWIDILYSEREQQELAVRMERAVRLARLVREFHVGGERLQVFDGAPEKVLPALVRARQYDVLVAGAVSRRNALRSAFGTLTGALVEATAGDVLLVKSDVPDPEAVSAAGLSVRQQLAHQF